MSPSKINEINLVIATSNRGKIREFRKLLACLPFNVIAQPELLNIEETGLTFAENARIKAFAASDATANWALADDSGLSVDALGGRPGVYSARYGNNDAVRIQRLLKEMEPYEERAAQFLCAICIACPGEKILLEVEGRCNGIITKKSRGVKGFGYDPVFEIANLGLTFAEMEIEQKQQISHRGIAFALLKPRLEKILGLSNEIV